MCNALLALLKKGLRQRIQEDDKVPLRKAGFWMHTNV